MPLLGGLFLTIFSPIFGYLASLLARKTAVIAAFLATSAVIIGGTVAAVKLGLQALIVSMPAGFSMGAWLFLPDNVGACVSACVAADITAAGMRWWHDNASTVAKVAGS